MTPLIVFIVPYRNRKEHKFFFCKYMSLLLEDTNYEIYFSHQHDVRSFNRGAMKNIGFQAVKSKYPDDYQEINFVFNDVDTIPYNSIFDYKTHSGIVKHYYGFEYALGGIVVIKGGDFEKINGFPNCWGWGSEDTSLQRRCLENGIIIDRSSFYKIGSPEILQLFDGVERIINRNDYTKVANDVHGNEGLYTLDQVIFTIDNESKNPADNVHKIENDNIFYVNVYHFLCGLKYDKMGMYIYDIRDSKQKIVHPSADRRTENVAVNSEDWKNINYRALRVRR